MAASGAVALYHIVGITPEVKQNPMLLSGAHRFFVNDLMPAYVALNSAASEIDLVSIGCPHASPEELHLVAEATAGKRIRAALWVTTARETREQATADVRCIEEAGGHVVADTCMVVAPVEQLGFRSLATNSAKMAFYVPSHSGLEVRFGSTEQCIVAAMTGTWPGS